MSRPQRRSKKLIFVLFLFFFSILAVIFFQSSLSKVQSIEVNGNERLGKEEVVLLSEIKIGDQILNLSADSIEKKLASNSWIKTVDVFKNFPGKVTINLTENQVVAYLIKEGRELYPILETGEILSPLSKGVVSDPLITEWPLEEDLVGFSKELATILPEIREEISEIRSVPTDNDPYRVILYMRDGFEVRTSMYNFAQHLNYYSHILASLEDEEKPGVINLTDAGISYISYKALAKQKEEGPSS